MAFISLKKKHKIFIAPLIHTTPRGGGGFLQAAAHHKIYVCGKSYKTRVTEQPHEDTFINMLMARSETLGPSARGPNLDAPHYEINK